MNRNTWSVIVACAVLAYGEIRPTRCHAQSDSSATPDLATQVQELQKEVKAMKDQAEADKKAAAAAATAAGQDIVSEDQKKTAPFSDAYWGWLNGNPRTTDFPLATKYFTPEIRVDTNYNLDFNHPSDDTISGSSEIFRSQEFQVEQLGLGGDFYVGNTHARVMTQFGEYSVTTPRNDGSPARGGWDLDNAYRYISEMYGGYHWDKMHGINFDAGIFMSYIGLFSYYNFDNWAYQPSFVSSNTPWFFTGLRGQFFPTAHLKIEPWFINGWQSYGRFNSKPGLGGQIKYAKGNINIISNNYGYGEDSAGNPNRARIHTDNSFELKYYDHKDNFLDRLAFSLTGDMGCELGNFVPASQSSTGNLIPGVACHHNSVQTVSGAKYLAYKQSFLGWMAYNRAWFNHDHEAVTIGGGQVNNPGRYLVLVPIINEATAITGTPYFTENPGDPYKGMDGTITYDYMPTQFVTFRTEYGYRHSNVPYWNGRRGMTPTGATTQAAEGSASDYQCTSASGSDFDSGVGFSWAPNTSYAQNQANNIANAKSTCAAQGATLWQPDLRKDEQKLTFAILVKF